jgi:hypothetical protein
VHAEALAVMVAVRADFVFDRWNLEILPYSASTLGASVITRRAFDWKRSSVSMLEVDVIPQSCIPYIQISLSIVL